MKNTTQLMAALLVIGTTWCSICCSQGPAMDGNSTKNLPMEARSRIPKFNEDVVWKVGDILSPPMCGDIRFVALDRNSIILKRDYQWKLDKEVAEHSVGNNVMMLIKKIDVSNNSIVVRFRKRVRVM